MKDFILLIDDDKAVGLTINHLLGKRYHVLHCFSMREAVDALSKAGTPQLIILDLMIPILNGFDFINYLKGLEKLRNIPIIVLSATESIEERRKCGEMGVDDFLKKPFNPVELELSVQKTLNKRRLESMKEISSQIKGVVRKKN